MAVLSEYGICLGKIVTPTLNQRIIPITRLGTVFGICNKIPEVFDRVMPKPTGNIFHWKINVNYLLIRGRTCTYTRILLEIYN